MALLDDLASPEYRAPSGPSCTIAILFQELDKATVETLTAAMDNPYAPSTKISQALKDMGKPVSRSEERRVGKECRL